MPVTFNRAVQRDVTEILEFYRRESGEKLADAFYDALLVKIGEVAAHARRFHFAQEPLRRANLDRFPYHFLFKETPGNIRILVIRHHRRRPVFGTKRF